MYKRIILTVDLDFHRALHIRARELGLSLSDVIRRLLQKWLAGEIGL